MAERVSGGILPRLEAAPMDAQRYVRFLQSTYADSEAQLIDLAKHLRKWGNARSQQLGDPTFLDGYEKAASAAASGKQPADEHTEYLKDQLLPSIIAVLPQDMSELIPSIGIGVLPLRSVNASASMTQSGNPVVLLDSGLFSMLSYFVESQMLLRNISSAHGMDEAVRFHENSYRFIIAYYEQSDLGFPIPETNIQVTLDQLLAVTAASIGAEIFVLCHELAHIHAGHLNTAQHRMAIVPSQQDRPLEVFRHDWGHEYEADEIGYEWYIKAAQQNGALKGFGVPRSLLMPFTFFQLAAFVENNVDGIDRQTHPPASYRASNLSRYISINLKGEAFVDELFKWALQTTDIVTQMPKVPH
jgi:hypothetical protein